MIASRKNNSALPVLALVIITLSSCANSIYRVADRYRSKVELLVSPDRVVLECEDIKDHDNAGSPEGNYGFLIQVLDEENTVTTVAQTNVLGREDCFERLREIGKILRDGKRITIGGMGDIDSPRVKGTFRTEFPGKGIFLENERSLQFMVIWNEHGQCYSAYRGPEKPCPRNEFPIHQKSD